jgi:hypothetical protein
MRFIHQNGLNPSVWERKEGRAPPWGLAFSLPRDFRPAFFAIAARRRAANCRSMLGQIFPSAISAPRAAPVRFGDYAAMWKADPQTQARLWGLI